MSFEYACGFVVFDSEKTGPVFVAPRDSRHRLQPPPAAHPDERRRREK